MKVARQIRRSGDVHNPETPRMQQGIWDGLEIIDALGAGWEKLESCVYTPSRVCWERRVRKGGKLA